MLPCSSPCTVLDEEERITATRGSLGSPLRGAVSRRLTERSSPSSPYFIVTTVTPSSPSPYLPRRNSLTAGFFLRADCMPARRVPVPLPWMM